MSEFVFSFTIIVIGTCTSKQGQLTVVHLAVCILTEVREINFTFKFLIKNWKNKLFLRSPFCHR